VDQSVAGYDATSQLLVLRKPQNFCLIMRIVLTVLHIGGMFLFQVKVKQSFYRPGVAQRVPGSEGSQIT
jgi:hypothetical protein